MEMSWTNIGFNLAQIDEGLDLCIIDLMKAVDWRLSCVHGIFWDFDTL